MIIVSDVVPIRERGKYLTLLGVGIAAGSGECLASGEPQLAYLYSCRTFSWCSFGSGSQLAMGVLDDGSQYVKKPAGS